MSANKRVYYAIERLGCAPIGSTSYTSVRGVQSVAMTTTFNLRQVFEWGQMAIYENIEGIPDVQVTVDRVLDGSAPIYTLATQGGSSATLAGRSQTKCQLAIGIYDETAESVSGNAITVVVLSGIYINSVSYTASVNDNASESCGFVGNNKVWAGGSTIQWTSEPFASNTDSPVALTGSGGVNQREDVLFGTDGSTMPTQIPGISATGKNMEADGGGYTAHIQGVILSTNLGREDLFELGTRNEYYKFATFPTEVTSEITVTSSSGDMISATADGYYTATDGTKYNLLDQTIILKMREGLHVDCGAKNKLSSTGSRGGDAGGGNSELTYTYTNFNAFTVYHPKDPNYAISDKFRPAA